MFFSTPVLEKGTIICHQLSGCATEHCTQVQTDHGRWIRDVDQFSSSTRGAVAGGKYAHSSAATREAGGRGTSSHHSVVQVARARRKSSPIVIKVPHQIDSLRCANTKADPFDQAHTRAAKYIA